MPGRVKRRAELAAALEFAPQMSALQLLLGEAQGSLASGLAASRSAATGVARSARRAIGPTRRAYQATRDRAEERQAAAVANIAGLGEAAVPFQAASQSESALAAQLAADSQRATVGELRQRAVDARTGAAHDARALRGQYQADVMRIAQQMQALAGQQGAASARYFADFLDDAADRRLERGRLRETQRHNRVSEGIAQQRENRQAREGRTNGGRGWLSQTQANTQFDLLEEARGFIRRLEGMGTGRIRNLLQAGGKLSVPVTVDGRPVTDTRGQPKTQTVTVPAIPKELVNAAFDLEEFGHLSWPNVQALHRRGLRIGRRYRFARPLPRGVAGPDVNERRA